MFNFGRMTVITYVRTHWCHLGTSCLGYFCTVISPLLRVRMCGGHFVLVSVTYMFSFWCLFSTSHFNVLPAWTCGLKFFVEKVSHLFKICACLFVFWGRVSASLELAMYVDGAGLELTEFHLPASPSWVLKLKFATMTSIMCLLLLSIWCYQSHFILIKNIHSHVMGTWMPAELLVK